MVIQAVAEPWETPDLLALAAGRDPCAPPGGPTAGTPVPRLTRPGRLTGLAGGWVLCGIRHPVLAEPDPGWLARPAVLAGLAGGGGGRAGL